MLDFTVVIKTTISSYKDESLRKNISVIWQPRRCAILDEHRKSCIKIQVRMFESEILCRLKATRRVFVGVNDIGRFEKKSVSFLTKRVVWTSSFTVQQIRA